MNTANESQPISPKRRTYDISSLFTWLFRALVIALLLHCALSLNRVAATVRGKGVSPTMEIRGIVFPIETDRPSKVTATPSSLMKWEYRTIVEWNKPRTVIPGHTIPTTDIESELRKAGEDSWEVISVGYGYSENINAIYLLKRQKR